MVVSSSFPLHSQESPFPSQALPASRGRAGSQGLPGAWQPVPVVGCRPAGLGVLAGGCLPWLRSWGLQKEGPPIPGGWADAHTGPAGREVGLGESWGWGLRCALGARGGLDKGAQLGEVGGGDGPQGQGSARH